MPKDSSGKFHMNAQRARAADRNKAEPMKADEPEAVDNPREERAEGEGGDEAVTSHLEAMQGERGGSHMHIHKHEEGYTTHHVGEDGTVEGPHHHPDEAALHEHIGRTLGGEEMPMHEGEAEVAMHQAKPNYSGLHGM